MTYFTVANLGYNPYGSLLFTSETELKNHPDVVAKVVAAAQAGWLKTTKTFDAVIKSVTLDGTTFTNVAFNFRKGSGAD